MRKISNELLLLNAFREQSKLLYEEAFMFLLSYYSLSGYEIKEDAYNLSSYIDDELEDIKSNLKNYFEDEAKQILLIMKDDGITPYDSNLYTNFALSFLEGIYKDETDEIEIENKESFFTASLYTFCFALLYEHIEKSVDFISSKYEKKLNHFHLITVAKDGLSSSCFTLLGYWKAKDERSIINRTNAAERTKKALANKETAKQKLLERGIIKEGSIEIYKTEWYSLLTEILGAPPSYPTVKAYQEYIKNIISKENGHEVKIVFLK